MADVLSRGIVGAFPQISANSVGSLGVILALWSLTRASSTGEDRLSQRHDGPKIGKDGKWQANLYDPDGTRVELMEFQPVNKPCCSPFTAESPVK